jgi:hypothetical protein
MALLAVGLFVLSAFAILGPGAANTAVTARSSGLAPATGPLNPFIAIASGTDSLVISLTSGDTVYVGESDHTSSPSDSQTNSWHSVESNAFNAIWNTTATATSSDTITLASGVSSWAVEVQAGGSGRILASGETVNPITLSPLLQNAVAVFTSFSTTSSVYPSDGGSAWEFATSTTGGIWTSAWAQNVSASVTPVIELNNSYGGSLIWLEIPLQQPFPAGPSPFAATGSGDGTFTISLTAGDTVIVGEADTEGAPGDTQSNTWHDVFNAAGGFTALYNTTALATGIDTITIGTGAPNAYTGWAIELQGGAAGRTLAAGGSADPAYPSALPTASIAIYSTFSSSSTPTDQAPGWEFAAPSFTGFFMSGWSRNISASVAPDLQLNSSYAASFMWIEVPIQSAPPAALVPYVLYDNLNYGESSISGGPLYPVEYLEVGTANVTVPNGTIVTHITCGLTPCANAVNIIGVGPMTEIANGTKQNLWIYNDSGTIPQTAVIYYPQGGYYSLRIQPVVDNYFDNFIDVLSALVVSHDPSHYVVYDNTSLPKVFPAQANNGTGYYYYMNQTFATHHAADLNLAFYGVGGEAINFTTSYAWTSLLYVNGQTKFYSSNGYVDFDALYNNTTYSAGSHVVHVQDRSFQGTAYPIGIVISFYDSLGPAGVPNAPTNLRAATVSTTEIDLTWVNPPGALTQNSVSVYSGGSGCPGSTFVATYVMGVTTSYHATALTPNTLYSFSVEAANSTGWSSPSACALNRTWSVPPAPTALIATTFSGTVILLQWNNPTTGGLIDNHLYTYTGASCGGSPSVRNLGGVTTTSSGVGLSWGTTYSFAVTVNNSTGESPHSNCAHATTFNVPPAPTDLVAAVLAAPSITLTWLNPVGPLVNDTVWEFAGPGCVSFIAVRSLIPAVQLYLVPSVIINGSYSFEVTASNTTGMSAPSTCVPAHTFGLPGPPKHLVAQNYSDTQINLTWVNPPGAMVNITVFIWVNVTCSGPFVSASIGYETTIWASTGLTPLTNYSYEIMAWNSTGHSPVSNCASNMTPYGVIFIPPSASQGNWYWVIPVLIAFPMACMAFYWKAKKEGWTERFMMRRKQRPRLRGPRREMRPRPPSKIGGWG